VIRFLLTVALIVGLAICGATVPLGKRTFFGHVRAIWSTDEAKDMREGIGEKAGPVVDRVKRGVEAAKEDPKKDDEAGSNAEKPAPR
jgi:hypothetical protein